MKGHENVNQRTAELIKKLELVKGAEIKLKKVTDNGESNLEAGTEISGMLDFDIVIGKGIFLNEGKSNTTPIQDIYENERKVYLKTRTSVYELITSEQNSSSTEKIKRPKSITTAKGSKYTYLEDGRTQRYKEVTGELHEPQDLLVFIPPWETIKERATKLYPDIFRETNSQHQFEQVILEFAQGKGRTMRPVNEAGKVITNVLDIGDDENIFIAFVDKNQSKVSFHLPVSKEPKIGWDTFDTRLYKDQDGNTMRERHIGNAVTNIEY